MGGLVGGKGGPKNQTTMQQSTATLPDWLTQPYKGAVSSAGDLFGMGPQSYFPNSTVAPNSAQTLTGLTTMEGLANDPRLIPGYMDTFQQFQDTLQGKGLANDATARGDYLYGGPGFNAALEAAQAKIQPMVKSAFNQGGRINGGLAQAAMADAIGNQFAGMYGAERAAQEGAIGRERAFQQGAMGAAPGMYNLAMAPAQTMMGVGGALEGKQQQQIADEIARWNFGQQAPQMNLSQYLGNLGQVAPFFGSQQQTSTQPLYSSGGSGLLGTALSLGGMFMGGPAGAALGGLGGLGGGMGTSLGLGDTLGAFSLY